MEEFRGGGFFDGIISKLFPSKLKVELTTDKFENGEVLLEPIFTINGKRVPPEYITSSKSQTIYGVHVVAHNDVIDVFNNTKGKRVSIKSSKGAKYLKELRSKGIRIKSKNKSSNVDTIIDELSYDTQVSLKDDGSLHIKSNLVNGTGKAIDNPSQKELADNDNWFVFDGDIYHVPEPESKIEEFIQESLENQILSGDDIPDFILGARHVKPEYSEIKIDPIIKSKKISPKADELFIKVSGDKNTIRVNPGLSFTKNLDKPEQINLEDAKKILNKGKRYKEFDDGWLGLDKDQIDKFQKNLNSKIPDILDKNEFRDDEIPRMLEYLKEGLNKSPWVVYVTESVSNGHKLLVEDPSVKFQLNIVDHEGSSLIQLDPIYNHSRFKLTHDEIKYLIEQGREWLRKPDTWIKLDREKIEKIDDEIKKQGIKEINGKYTFEASERDRILQIFSKYGTFEHSEAYSQFLAKLADFEKIEATDLPKSLKPGISLRSYQKHGYDWLYFLKRFNLNGLLADDMGLGKTLQTLAIIAKSKEETPYRQPSLVICPTSVVRNWYNETNKFFYPITTRIYGGSNRKSNNQNWAYGYDVVITSYGIARIDCHFLSQTFWNYIILDEAHTIKNPSTETAKAMKIIPAKHRLALTGTPIQNSPDELWALFDFLMPKYLKSREKFREEYTSNLRQNSSNFNETAEKLKSRIHPFILRRLKEDVAKDLPEKIQIERPVELSKKQVALYKQFTKSEDFRKLEDEIDKKGVKRSGIMILQIYSALRNLCNHPNIITHPQDYLRDPKLQDSGKLEMLKELLEEIESGGHRALLFCQSTRMLDIIEYFYKQWNYNYLRLDGSTSQGSRSKYVDEFNENKNILCFLISTKAGGTGLNLTGADTVIFYDHDWNPANDKQAQDRAYRIGQTKNVSVYKLVSKGTIEEKIINRQIIKSKVAEAIIQADPEGFKDISKEDLLNLFKLDEE